MNHDDIPVGSHTRDMNCTPTKNIETDTTLDARLISKSWSTRSDAFTELIALLSSPDNFDIAQSCASQFIKYLADPHPGVQEKAINAFSNLIKSYPSTVISYIEQITNVMLEKCVTAMKPAVKTRALETLLELAKTNECKERLVKAIIDNLITCKAPKTLVGDLQTLTQLLKNLGRKAFDMNEVMKAVEENASSNNGAVRNEALEVYKAGYLVYGEEIMQFIKKLKPAQQEELIKAFKGHPLHENVEDDNDEPCILEKANTISASSLSNYSKVTIAGNMKERQVDEEWCSRILSLKNWKEKREELDNLIPVLSSPTSTFKISPTFISALQKLTGDNNLSVVESSLKVVSLLAIKFEEGLESYYPLLIKPVLLHLKDKKIIAEVMTCLKSLNITLDTVMDDVKELLNDKSPLLRVGLCQWLENTLIPAFTTSNNIPELFLILSKLLDDTTGDVRDAILSCLGLIYSTSSSPNLLEGLTQQKVEKIVMAAKEKGSMFEQRKTVNKVPTTRNKVKSPSLASREVPEKLNTRRKGKRNTIENAMINETIEVDTERVVSEIIPLNISEALDKVEWKERLKGFQELSCWISSNKEKVDLMLIPITLFLKDKLKDFKENNQTIIKEAFTILSHLVQSKSCSKKFGGLVTGGILEKMSDTKWYEAGVLLMQSIAESSGVAFTSKQIMDKLSSSAKNMNLVRAGLLLLTHMVDKYELAQLPLKELVECAKQALASANSLIRSTATGLLCSLYKCMGESLKPMLSDLKEATMKAVETELAKVQCDKNEVHMILSKEQLNPEDVDYLLQVLQEKIKEPLTKDSVILIRDIIGRIGSEINSYKVILKLVESLNDKDIKKEIVITMNKLEEVIGTEIMISEMSKMLEKNSVGVRVGILDWLLQKQKLLSITECNCLLKGITICRQDKSTKNKAEELLTLVKKRLESSKRTESKNVKVSNVENIQMVANLPKQISPRKVLNEKVKLKKLKLNRIECAKIYRWQYENLTEDTINNVKEKLKGSIDNSLVDNMFSNDETMRINSINSLIEIAESADGLQKITKSLEPFLKWSTISLLGKSSSTTIEPTIKLLKIVFSKLVEVNYKLTCDEAGSILPILCERLEESTRTIIRKISTIFPLSKLANYLVRALDTQCDKTKVECLKSIRELIEEYGLDIITARDIKSFGKILNQTNSEQVEVECINLLAEIYRIKGEKIWANIGELSSQVKSSLKEKFVSILIGKESKINSSPGNFSSSNPKSFSNSQSSPLKKNNTKECRTIEECIAVLNSNELTQLAEALDFLDQRTTSELRKKRDELINTFASSLHKVFEINKLPLILLQKKLSLINKVCSTKEIVHDISNDLLLKLMHELLSALLNSNKTEASLMKLVNSSMLSLMKTCSPNTVFPVLISLYQTSATKEKLSELTMKCILILIKELHSMASELNVSNLFLNLQNYLASTPDPLGIRMVKTIINQLIKIRGESIWKDYNNAGISEDTQIKKWISLMLVNNIYNSKSYSNSPKNEKFKSTAFDESIGKEHKKTDSLSKQDQVNELGKDNNTRRKTIRKFKLDPIEEKYSNY